MFFITDPLFQCFNLYFHVLKYFCSKSFRSCAFTGPTISNFPKAEPFPVSPTVPPIYYYLFIWPLDWYAHPQTSYHLTVNSAGH